MVFRTHISIFAPVMTKKQKYDEMLPQMAALLQGETEEMSVLANAAALLKHTFQWFWVGFYVVREGELRLGPFQGSVACTHIGRGKGVCGTAWEQCQTIVVDDVEQFPGHIACSSLSKSEIVVPIFDAKGEVVGVIDIDSDELSTFDQTDAEGLRKVAHIISDNIYK